MRFSPSYERSTCRGAVGINRKIAGAVESHRAALSAGNTQPVVRDVDREIFFVDAGSVGARLVDGAIAIAVVVVSLLPKLSPA
jgi:hypothetical protein